jgi:hypothetical protein
MSRFTFSTDADSEAFCLEIAAKMIELFGIPESESIGRISRHWDGQSITGPCDMIYHEDAEYWAKTVYFGKESFWWKGEQGSKATAIPLVLT